MDQGGQVGRIVDQGGQVGRIVDPQDQLVLHQSPPKDLKLLAAAHL